MRITSDPALFDNDGADTVLVVDGGSSIVYGRSRYALNLGTVAVGSSLTLTDPMWVASTGAFSELHAVTPLAAIAGPLSQGGQDVATTSTLVVPVNAGRSALYLSNGSDTGMWLYLADTGAAVGMGLFLPPGQSWIEAYTGAVSAVHIGASGTKRIGLLEL